MGGGLGSACRDPLVIPRAWQEVARQHVDRPLHESEFVTRPRTSRCRTQNKEHVRVVRQPRKCKDYGVKRFGLHTMVVSNCLKARCSARSRRTQVGVGGAPISLVIIGSTLWQCLQSEPDTYSLAIKQI